MSKFFVYDFTLYNVKPEDHNVVLDWCKEYCKKYGFQGEIGEECGTFHFQGRCSFNKQYRINEIPKNELDFHFSLTSTENKKTCNFYKYCTKSFTRSCGPWTDKDEEPTIETVQLKMFKEMDLRGYQQDILNWVNEFHMRQIDLIYDPVGNLGKSLFCEYLEFIGGSEEIPPYRLMDDIFQWVFCRPKKKMYIMDLPRGMKKDKLADLYAGIEIIKNGVAYDKRYTAKKIRFDRPRVVVFTNELPCLELMSKDRWKIWQVQKDYSLKDISDTINDITNIGDF